MLSVSAHYSANQCLTALNLQMRYLTPLDYALINVRPNCAEYLAKNNGLPGIIYTGIMANRVRLAWRRFRRRKYGRWVKSISRTCFHICVCMLCSICVELQSSFLTSLFLNALFSLYVTSNVWVSNHLASLFYSCMLSFSYR